MADALLTLRKGSVPGAQLVEVLERRLDWLLRRAPVSTVRAEFSAFLIEARRRACVTDAMALA